MIATDATAPLARTATYDPGLVCPISVNGIRALVRVWPHTDLSRIDPRYHADVCPGLNGGMYRISPMDA
jgi:hypothetical protein